MATNRDKNLPAHHINKGDPKINGPFLDDVRADQERAYREVRKKAGAATPVNESLIRKRERQEQIKKEAQAAIDRREKIEKSAQAYLLSRKNKSAVDVKSKPADRSPAPTENEKNSLKPGGQTHDTVNKPAKKKTAPKKSTSAKKKAPAKKTAQKGKK